MTKLNANGVAYIMCRLTFVTILHISKYKTPKTMFKCCFRGEETDGKGEESSYLLFVA